MTAFIARLQKRELIRVMEWGNQPENSGVAIPLRRVPPRILLAVLIASPQRLAAALVERWRWWTALPGDHWHDFQAMRCYTVEHPSLRGRPTFTREHRSMLAGGEVQTEHGTRPGMERLIFVHPGNCRQMVKLIFALEAFAFGILNSGPWGALVIVAATAAISCLMLNARHVQDRP